MSVDNMIGIRQKEDGNWWVFHGGPVWKKNFNSEEEVDEFILRRRNPEEYETLQEAENQAKKIREKILNSSFPILEHGICRIKRE